jgi:hypothetical protein
MLVGLNNPVKVESIPLNSEQFPAIVCFTHCMGRWLSVAAVAVIAVAVVFAIIGVTRGSLIAGTPVAAPIQETSDEDQVRDVVDQFEQAWNDNDFDALRQLMCADLRADGQFSTDELRGARQVGGRLALTIESIEFGGLTATAIIENYGAEPDDIRFVFEADEWKWCEP